MTTIKNALVRLVKDEDGASAVEYALLVSLIAVVVVAAVKTLGTTANKKFTDATSGIAN